MAYAEGQGVPSLVELPKRSQALRGLMDTYVQMNLHA
jgi:hypothetical protein